MYTLNSDTCVSWSNKLIIIGDYIIIDNYISWSQQDRVHVCKRKGEQRNSEVTRSKGGEGAGV